MRELNPSRGCNQRQVKSLCAGTSCSLLVMETKPGNCHQSSVLWKRSSKNLFGLYNTTFGSFTTPLDIHPWIRCTVISHGLIQSAIPNACASGHYSGEGRLSFIVSLISNSRLVIFMPLLVAQTSVCVPTIRVSKHICSHYSLWQLFMSNISSIYWSKLAL